MCLTDQTKNKIRSDAGHKADLFNNFFAEQFSDASHYDIPIDFQSDSDFDISSQNT